MNFLVSSTLPPQYRPRVERLVFFNRQQERRRDHIVCALGLYGQPQIAAPPAGVSVWLDGPHSTQCLFALMRRRSQLIVCGVIVYARPSDDEVAIVHVAISNFLSQGSPKAEAVVRHLIRQVRNVAHQVRGIEWIRMPYTGKRFFRIPPARNENRERDALPVPTRRLPHYGERLVGSLTRSTAASPVGS